MSDPYELAYLVDRFMRRIAAGLHTKALEIDTDRVGPFGGMVLLTLSDIQPTPIHKLVDQMGRDKSQMTRTIKSLEEKGMIDRQSCPEDGRVSLLLLSDKGQDFVVQIKAILSNVIDGILTPVSKPERDGLIEVLRKI